MYPKSYFTDRELVINSGTCFLIMPFAAKFEPVFTAIKETLENDLGLACARTKELLGGGNIIEDILRGIGESEFIVVDVTGKNPNVFYELGIAHMCKDVEKVVLLSQEIESIPFDLRHFRHIVYKPTAVGIRALRQNLRDTVGAIQHGVHQIVVNNQGQGNLPDLLMGTDHCLYQFEILQGFFGFNAAKFLLQVTCHVMGAIAAETTVVFHKGMGLSVGEQRLIGNTEWAISLERVSRERSVLRIHKAESYQEAASQRYSASSKRNTSKAK